MKMLYFSVTLMIALLAATAYLAQQARDEAIKANAKMDLITRQQKAVEAQNVEVMLPPPTPEKPAAAPVVAAAPVAPTPAATSPTQPSPKVSQPLTEAAPPSRPAGSPPPVPAPPMAAATTAPVTSASAPAGSPPIAEAPVPTPGPAPLTPAQRLVKSAPSIGKVKEFVADQGFVVLSAGSKQGINQGLKFDIRRDASIIGRIKITNADENEAVADLDFKSVPTGVTIREGDEIIGVVLQR